MNGPATHAAASGLKRAQGQWLAVTTWGTAASVWAVGVFTALVACRWLPQARETLNQPIEDAATWGVAANAGAMLCAVLWQRRRLWQEAAHERAALSLAFGNVGAAALTLANALLPAPLLPLALPPLTALALAAGCAAAAIAAARHTRIRSRQHGR